MRAVILMFVKYPICSSSDFSSESPHLLCPPESPRNRYSTIVHFHYAAKSLPFLTFKTQNTFVNLFLMNKQLFSRSYFYAMLNFYFHKVNYSSKSLKTFSSVRQLHGYQKFALPKVTQRKRQFSSFCASRSYCVLTV